MMTDTYIFKSERLGFRNWVEQDIPKMFEINSDTEVMEFFPRIPTLKDTEGFIQKMKSEFEENGHCYFAVETLRDGNFIGFIGLAKQTYEAEFTPCVDIGWRLHRKVWSKGYATEGAKFCLDFAFNKLNLSKVYSIAPITNIKSEHVMKKIGMTKVMEFEHSLLLEHGGLKQCVLYAIKR